MTSEVEAQLASLLERLANREHVRSEATVQSDIRWFLLSGGLGLADHDLSVDLETPVGGGRRIDIEVGYTVIEVKRDLRSATVLADAERQLAGYVSERTAQTGQRYVGILTDGADWHAYQMRGEALVEADRFTIRSRPDSAPLLAWLEGVLATRKNVPPTPEEIDRQLGASSSSYKLDKAALAAMYAAHGSSPTVQLKRELWAKLLRSALGTQFTDDDELFLEHTLLVNSADIIAHLVLGLNVNDIAPTTLLNGARFALSSIYGVVEEDFFDWVVEIPGGDSYVRSLARRLSRFDWSNVDHDVLKVLYESVIGTETRKRLGEYYTPDWLADQIISDTVTDPLRQNVVDPACGSGTFVFHAARRYLEAAERDGIPLAQALAGLTDHVMGIDLHPVAVALARVTYLLAIGRERLVGDRGQITVPVYLGDSIQWSQRMDLFNEGSLVVSTGTGTQLFGDELRFPDHLLADAAGFDRLINELADLATSNRLAGTVPSLSALFRRLGIAEIDRPSISDAFRTLCRLHDEGRNHIWSYYIRNLVRPVWLSRIENRVDILVGNPPWLSYRHMPADMQEIFRKMSEDRGLWHGKTVATHQDLSGLFVARVVQLYLKAGGNFAFVMPNPVLDRGYFEGFRTGHYPDPSEVTSVEFSGSWDLRRLRPHFFPRGGAVVFGSRTSGTSKSLPVETLRWTGTLPRGSHSWSAVKAQLSRESARLVVHGLDAEGPSAYAARFSQGATIVPRVLFFVRPQPASPLGYGAGNRAVQSARSSTEKSPWKDLPDLCGVVEAEFIRPVLLGENVLPFRVISAREAVLPLEGRDILDGEHPNLDLYPGLAQWWRRSEDLWQQNRSSERLTLKERLDFRRGLSQQLPGSALRLVYAKAGMHVAATLVDNPNMIIDHKLYWATVSSRAEGLYLCAILNSPKLTEIVRPYMSYGKDERDIDKHLWKLPIQTYDPHNPVHTHLADMGRQQEEIVMSLELDENGNFVTLRRQARAALASERVSGEIDDLVTELLGEA